MEPRFWMISNRAEERPRPRSGRRLGPVRLRQRGEGTLGMRLSDELTYWIAEASSAGKLDQMASWEKVNEATFKASLIEEAKQFPKIVDPAEHEKEKHVNLFIHGYNVSWEDAARRYAQLCRDLFSGDAGLGLSIFFTWPSDGMVTNYYSDRRDARRSADHLAEVLNNLYDYLAAQQEIIDPDKRCRAKTSVIAHSMGNFVLQHAMSHCWVHNNRPLSVSLINQLIMVAADVDNDIFKSGELHGASDGDPMAQLSYRITSLFTGRDPVLGLSAGMKHFGKRRLGRSGIDRRFPIPDNVCDIDCSSLIPAGARNIHSAYFESPEVIQLMRELLRGVDRHVLAGNRDAIELHATA